jgi:hypothetical protein
VLLLVFSWVFVVLEIGHGRFITLFQFIMSDSYVTWACQRQELLLYGYQSNIQKIMTSSSSKLRVGCAYLVTCTLVEQRVFLWVASISPAARHSTIALSHLPLCCSHVQWATAWPISTCSRPRAISLLLFAWLQRYCSQSLPFESRLRNGRLLTDSFRVSAHTYHNFYVFPDISEMGGTFSMLERCIESFG